MSSIDPTPSSEPPGESPPRSRLTSVPVDALTAHIATMLRTLDDEVKRLRDEAAEESSRAIAQARTRAERIVADAGVKAERIFEEVNRQVAEAEARRDAVLEERQAVIEELAGVRDTIVGLAGRFDREPGDVMDPSDPARAKLPPPPPRGRRVDENQQALFADPPPPDAGQTSATD